MITILTKTDLIDLSLSNSKELSLENFKLPVSFLNHSDEIIYLNGDSSQLIKTRQGISSVEDLQAKVIWNLIDGQSYDKTKKLLFDVESQLGFMSFVKAG